MATTARTPWLELTALVFFAATLTACPPNEGQSKKATADDQADEAKSEPDTAETTD